MLKYLPYLTKLHSFLTFSFDNCQLNIIFVFSIIYNRNRDRKTTDENSDTARDAGIGKR